MSEGEQRYRELFATLLEGYCTIEMVFDEYGKAVDYRFLEVNPAFENHTGMTNARGRLISELAPGIESHWIEIYGRVAITGEPVRFEARAQPLGRDYEARAYRLGQPEKCNVGVVFNDITERKNAERTLRAQFDIINLLNQITRAVAERKDLPGIFQVVIRSLEDKLPIDFGCMCLYDAPTNDVTVVNVGRCTEVALAMALGDQARVHVGADCIAKAVIGQVIYEPDTRVAESPFPTRLAQGGFHSMVAAPILIEGKVFGVLVAARNAQDGFSSDERDFLRQLSEHVALAVQQAQLNGALKSAYEDLRKTQESVLQQERLRALGQMASGIAHDINNAISPVSLYTDSLLEREVNLSAEGRGQLQVIQRAISDVAQTIGRLREFYRARESQMNLTHVKLNELVQQVVDLTRVRWIDMPQMLGITIKVQTEFASSLPLVLGADNEIREALINLVFNSVDAMPAGGTLTLRTRVDRAHVHVEVADTGVGMDEDARRQCLEPFVTTKGERGTGLGLAMVYGMVKRHNADIAIESEPGRGTTFRVTFAAALTTAEVPIQVRTPAVVPAALRILLVDDDSVLLKSLCDTLEADGHTVVTANGGRQGIELFSEADGFSRPFRVVITDLGMPYVDGRQVATAVKFILPSTPVILLTGWGDQLLAEGTIPANVDLVLAKPPRIRDLREALVRCCGAEAAPAKGDGSLRPLA